MREILNLGVLSVDQLIALYPGSHLVQNLTQDTWESTVKAFAEYYPDWLMLKEPVYKVTYDNMDLYLQRNVITIPDETGLSPLASELFSDFIVDISNEDLDATLETVFDLTGHGMSFLNCICPRVKTSNYLYAETEAILLDSDATEADYFASITSKKRNSVKSSLKLAGSFTYERLQSLTSKDALWIAMRLLQNFAEDGTGEDNAYVVEFSQAQWLHLVANSHNPFIHIYKVMDGEKTVGYVGYVVRSPSDIEPYAGREVCDFTSFVQDRSYKGVGSAMLYTTATKLRDELGKSVAVLLNTAPPPGTDFNYYQYKRNCSNANIQTVNALATYATVERVFSCSYDSKNKEWK